MKRDLPIKIPPGLCPYPKSNDNRHYDSLLQVGFLRECCDYFLLSKDRATLELMKPLKIITVEEVYKSASITLTLATWSDGTVSLATAKYVFGNSNIGGFKALSDDSRFYAAMEEAREAGLTWAKKEIDKAA